MSPEFAEKLKLDVKPLDSNDQACVFSASSNLINVLGKVFRLISLMTAYMYSAMCDVATLPQN